MSRSDGFAVNPLIRFAVEPALKGGLNGEYSIYSDQGLRMGRASILLA